MRKRPLVNPVPTKDALSWGGAPLSVEVRKLYTDEVEGDFEIVPEEPVKPRWRTLKRWLKAVGIQAVAREAGYDRFKLGTQALALTRDGRFILEGVKPPTTSTALALAQLFLLCDAATERRRPDDVDVAEGGE
jgi:hypothetical protein